MADAHDPVALTVDSAGRILYAERGTGRVRRIDRNDHLEAAPIATVEVSTEGQRGLLGVAIDKQDHVFVAYTDRSTDQLLTVSRVQDRVEQIVWRGPKSESKANGGHLAFAPNGVLVLGVGELAGKHLDALLGAPPKGFTPGRLLQLDPAGRVNQVPRVLSYGWHNPFAFVVGRDGAIWVADNAPDGTPERLARGDRETKPTEVIEFTKELIPTALAPNIDGTWLMCSLTSSQLLGQTSATKPFNHVVAKTPCSRALLSLNGGRRIVFSTDVAIYSYDAR